MTSHRSFLFVVDCYVQLFNSLVFQCDDMVSKCREMTSRSKPWFEVMTQVALFPTEEQSTTPKGGRYFSGSLGIQLPRLFGDGPMIAGKTYRVLFWFLCVDCIMLQSSFTWDEIAFEHVQCVIDDTGFRFKATSGSETHTMLKMNTRATHQRFLIGKLQIFLSASGVHFSCLLHLTTFNCQAAISKAQGLIGSLEEGTSKAST